MNGPPRIIFAHCMNDQWIMPVSADLHRAAGTLSCELVVVGMGPNSSLPPGSYLDVSSLDRGILPALMAALPTRQLDLADQVAGEQALYHLSGRATGAGEIGKRLAEWYAEAELLLKIIQPDLAVVWNGMTSRRALFASAVRNHGLPLFFAEKGLLPDSWYLDPIGINPQSSIAVKPVGREVATREGEEWRKTLRMIDESGSSAWEQPARKGIHHLRKKLGMEDNRKIVFFPGQVDSDTNILFFSPWFKNTLDALEWLVEGLPADEYRILAKPHPRGSLIPDDFSARLGTRGEVLTDLNIIDAIELADCVVSINSTVAFEAAIRAKPVLLLGESVLSEREFVSCGRPGRDAASQVAGCIDRYRADRDSLHRKALSLAAYLDLHYYAYRGNDAKTVARLEAILTAIGEVGDKAFSLDEIAGVVGDGSADAVTRRLLKRVSSRDLRDCIPGRVLFKAACKKVRDRILGRTFNS